MSGDHGDGNVKYDAHRNYPIAVIHSDKKLFQQAIRALALPDKKFWKDAVRKDVDEVYVALLMMVLPNLQEISISAPMNPVVVMKALYHCLVLRPAEARFMGLQKVETLSWAVRGNVCIGNMNHLALVLRMPSIKAIKNYPRMASKGTTEYPRLPTKSTLKHLTIYDSSPEPEFLTKILIELDSPQNFEYEYYDFCSPGSSLVPRKITEALEATSRNSLQKISIGELYWKREATASVPHTLLGSFDKFPSLRKLKTNITLLIASCPHTGAQDLRELLPQSLEVLLVRGIRDECCVRHLLRLVESKPVTFKRLGCIKGWTMTQKELEKFWKLPSFALLLNAARDLDVSLIAFIFDNDYYSRHADLRTWRKV